MRRDAECVCTFLHLSAPLRKQGSITRIFPIAQKALAFARARVTYSSRALKVSQASILPVCMPRLNQRTRWADVP